MGVEDATTCPADCAVCGDGVCSTGFEDVVTCPADCARCGDGLCTEGFEDIATCPADCASCGDGVCSSGFEDVMTCPADCAVCGDGICSEGFEDVMTCPADCAVCGDGICSGGVEDVTSCPLDCALCGDGICSAGVEDAASCPADCALCGDGICSEGVENVTTCAVDCAECGDGVCSSGVEDVASCPEDCAVCGDGVCSGGVEDVTSCPLDCALCGDGICSEGVENVTTCPADCAECGDGICSSGFEDVMTCPADCAVCGDSICSSGVENVTTCPEDCAECGDGICSGGVENVATCAVDCAVCGDGICSVGVEDVVSCPEDCAGCENYGAIGELRLTSDSSTSAGPSLAWTGSEYGVSWEDYRDGNYEIYFARISAAGVKTGSDVRITNAANDSYSPSLVWTGSEYGVSWKERRDGNHEIYFARISSSGVKTGSDVRITNDSDASYNPSLVWTGSEYGVSWYDDRDGNDEIYFARISAAGVKTGSDVRITNAANDSYNPSLVWTGSEYGVSWYDDRDGNREVYFARVSSSGVKTGSDVRITNAANDSYNPSLVWTGSEYGVSWKERRDGNHEIYFARISSSGVKTGSDVRITNDSDASCNPSLVWTGSEYGVSWYDYRDGNREIYFARISSSGVKTGSDVRITNDSDASYNPSLVWTGSEYGVSWYDDRHINWEIYFARIGCI